MLLHINPTRQRGKRTGSLAGASGWYMTFFAAGVIRHQRRRLQLRVQPAPDLRYRLRVPALHPHDVDKQHDQLAVDLPVLSRPRIDHARPSSKEERGEDSRLAPSSCGFGCRSIPSRARMWQPRWTATCGRWCPCPARSSKRAGSLRRPAAGKPCFEVRKRAAQSATPVACSPTSRLTMSEPQAVSIRDRPSLTRPRWWALANRPLPARWLLRQPARALDPAEPDRLTRQNVPPEPPADRRSRRVPAFALSWPPADRQSRHPSFGEERR